MKRNDSLKEYFAAEVNRRRTPPLPGKYSRRTGKKSWRDDLITFAAAAAVFAIILTPGIYDNQLRQFRLNRECAEELQKIVPHVIHEASVYFKNQNRGV